MRQPSAGCGEAGLWRNTTGFSSSQEVKKNGSKRIKKIRAPSASFRGSTRCDQHGPLSCERAGLRLLLGLLGALAVRCGSRCCSPIRVCSLRRGCRSVAARRRRGFLEVQFGVLPPLKPMQWNPAHGRSPSCDIKELASARVPAVGLLLVQFALLCVAFCDLLLYAASSTRFLQFACGLVGGLRSFGLRSFVSVTS